MFVVGGRDISGPHAPGLNGNMSLLNQTRNNPPPRPHPGNLRVRLTNKMIPESRSGERFEAIPWNRLRLRTTHAL